MIYLKSAKAKAALHTGQVGILISYRMFIKYNALSNLFLKEFFFMLS